MTEKLEIYKCEICGNIIQILSPGYGELVCCNQPMKLQIAQQDNGELGEKHSPKIEFHENKKYVQVTAHPMLPEHYIQFIEVYSKDKDYLYLKYFNPNEIPEMDVSHIKDSIEAIEFCNIHGLWRENKND